MDEDTRVVGVGGDGQRDDTALRAEGGEAEDGEGQQDDCDGGQGGTRRAASHGGDTHLHGGHEGGDAGHVVDVNRGGHALDGLEFDFELPHDDEDNHYGHDDDGEPEEDDDRRVGDGERGVREIEDHERQREEEDEP